MDMEELGIVSDMPKGWINGKDQPLWHYKIYNMWRNMWGRVKNPDDKDYKNYKDCKIYEEFKYLSKYVEWIMQEPRFEEFIATCDKVIWNIDKDMKYPENRNYYPQYMTLTTKSENTKERNDRRGNPKPKTPIIAIDNTKVLLFKSTLDAQNKGFKRVNISRCINKSPGYKTHKGYKWYKINYKHNLRLRIKKIN